MKKIFYLSLLVVVILISQISQDKKSEGKIDTDIEKYKSNSSIRICNHN